MAKPTLYWKSTCTSCRDARSFLRERKVDFEDVNYAKEPLEVEVVEQIVAAAGGVAAVLNTRHAYAKSENWAEDPPKANVFARAVVLEPNLLRRPILISGSKVIVGFDKDAYKAI